MTLAAPASMSAIGSPMGSLPLPAAAAPAALAGCPLFPADNVWNTRVDTLPVAARSAEYVAGIGAGLPLHADFGSSKYGDFGIPINTVAQGAAKLPVSFEYADESDSGPYPIPDSPKIEAGGDRPQVGDDVLVIGTPRAIDEVERRASRHSRQLGLVVRRGGCRLGEVVVVGDPDLEVDASLLGRADVGQRLREHLAVRDHHVLAGELADHRRAHAQLGHGPDEAVGLDHIADREGLARRARHLASRRAARQGKRSHLGARRRAQQRIGRAGPLLVVLARDVGGGDQIDEAGEPRGEHRGQLGRGRRARPGLGRDRERPARRERDGRHHDRAVEAVRRPQHVVGVARLAGGLRERLDLDQRLADRLVERRRARRGRRTRPGSTRAWRPSARCRARGGIRSARASTRPARTPRSP